MNRFENKVVVITGAAGGIGEATTRRIVSEGGKVVIADHSEKRAEQLANELTHAGADVRHVYFSATELQSCKELIDFSMNEYQRIDVLINNVGGTDPKRDLSIEKLDINYFDEAFHLNLCCTMYLSQQVIPIMTANGGGNIVNVASISGHMQNNDLNICPYENERTISIKEAIKDSSANTIGIFVGPEGGFEEEEVEKIQEIDGKVVSLGPRILRTETASVVASSIVLYELSDLGGNI